MVERIIGIAIFVVVFFLIYVVGVGAGLTIQAMDREGKWDESKKEAVLNILISIGWPIVWLGAFLYLIFILMPRELHKWWTKLPD